jgi:Secretion system C-terminal sorting domain/IPT/TIG domain
MIRKLLFASMLTICCIMDSMAQQPTDTIYSDNIAFVDSTTILSKLWDVPAGSGAKDSIGGPVDDCGDDGKQLEITYATSGFPGVSAWWAGGGRWQINGWAYYAPKNSKIRDYSQYTYMKVSYSWIGNDSRVGLTLSFTDSTSWTDTATYISKGDGYSYQQPTSYTTGPSVNLPAADGNGSCTTVLIPLSQFVGSYTDSTQDYSDYNDGHGGHGGTQVWNPRNINLSNLQTLNWGFSGYDGSTQLNGTFYVDDMMIVDMKPVITSLSATSGQAGTVISITGANFKDSNGNILVNDVSFDGGGGSASYNVVSATQIDVTIPAGASGTVTVTTGIPVNTGIDYLQATSSQSFSNVAGISAKNASLNVSIAPNPSTGIFNITSPDKIDEVIVSDKLGNVILNSSNSSIDLSNQPEGLYFLTIISGEKKSVQKLAKQ